MKIAAGVMALLLCVAGCGGSSSGSDRAKPDPVKVAITSRYGDCLTKLKFTKPFKINVYKATHKADVSGKPGVVGFKTSTGTGGKVYLLPLDDGSSRALESVGC